MKLRKIITAVLAAAVVLTAVSCGVDLSSTKEESRTVIKVDGYEVPYELYRYAALMHLRDQADVISANAEETGEAEITTEKGAAISAAVATLTKEERDALAEQIKADSIETIVNIYSLFTAAKEEGIDPFSEMINDLTDMKMEEIRATYDSDSVYKEALAQFYMNNSVYSLLTRYEIVFEQLYEMYVKNGDIDISDEAVIEYMNGEEAVRAKQILISFERHTEEEAYDLACSVAEEVAKCISDDGTVDEDKFDSLTDEYGEDLFMFKNRDGYYICKGYSDEAFEAAAFALEVGEVSQPVRISAGYSIILRTKKDLDYIKENVDELKEGCLGGIYRSMLDEYSANAKVETTEEFDALDIYSMK